MNDQVSATHDVVDVIAELSHNTYRVANAITPLDAIPNTDANGGTVASLTESVMGVTGGLVQIAGAIEALADAVHALAAVHENED